MTFSIASPILGATLCASIMDYARLPLPAVSLSVINLADGKSYIAKSDEKGHVCVSSLSEGLFSVEASLAGFLHVKYYPVRVASSTPVNLSFWLPFGEIKEGGIGQESTLSGTLLQGGSPVESAEICATRTTGVLKACTTTNDVGQYALVLQMGMYQIEIRAPKEGKLYKSVIDLTTPGMYRNRLSLNTGPNQEVR